MQMEVVEEKVDNGGDAPNVAELPNGQEKEEVRVIIRMLFHLC